MAVVVSFADEAWRDDVGPIDGVTPVIWDPDGEPPVEDVEVYVAPYGLGTDFVRPVAAKPSVRLVQLMSAGYDGVIEELPPGVALANGRGIHDAATAELAVALTLASLRDIPDMVLAQARGEWLPKRFSTSLADRRVLIIGYGSIGRAIAARMLPFETTVTAVASRARGGDDLVDRVYGIDDLATLAPDHDVVVLVTPLTDSTRGLAGESFLASLPDGALVVNVGRGPVLDTATALRHAGRLRFALDVTDPEPLPADHPLWTAPGVLIAPHVGGLASSFRSRAVRLIREQLRRVVAGEEPLNIVHAG
ncbi:2-hydroxyacid dehydrogenase [Kribbia dieselivorans]|uniref:2-hydroxyacid dehydrogenase n=1 Tax=Kribbia dieselivorans TaxID=331526 RepID=UPI000837D687|nr:2-hydroxyacid dehydrogenase [Kribbia dieselivorans]